MHKVENSYTENKKTVHDSSEKKETAVKKENKTSEENKQPDKPPAVVPGAPKIIEKNSEETTKSAKNKNKVPVKIADTVDGDTIKVNYHGKVETVRYLLVDTPEEKKPGTCVQLYSVEAYNRNKQLVNSGELSLEFEKSGDRDKYGRLLAYVFVDGKSVQEVLLKEGYARVAYIYDPPYKYLSQYQKDERSAKQQKLKIWSKPGFTTDSGFSGCTDSSKTTTNKSTDSNTPSGSGKAEIFANCTELRKKYPSGVPSTHPAYQNKMDRDQDHYACEP
ncbi:thermonuclease family protein [Neobacillus mesonae]|nr:thermonuclease family protein [Neobacillus mesonae]MCM3567627.1 thermonuclease family protein [Neobacillus mesonae]